MKKIPNIHPGEILSEEFLIPMGISAYRLAKETKINPTRVSEIVNGKRGISVDTALRFSKFFGNSVEFWMGIQDEYEIREERSKISKELSEIKSYKELAVAKKTTCPEPHRIFGETIALLTVGSAFTVMIKA